MTTGHRSEAEVQSALEPLSRLLSTPPQYCSVRSIKYVLGRTVQQVTYYTYPGKTFQVLEIGTNMICDTLERQQLIEGMQQGEVSGLHEYRGQTCEAWMITLMWTDGTEALPLEHGGKYAELYEEKSLSGPGKAGRSEDIFLGSEERNCKSLVCWV